MNESGKESGKKDGQRLYSRPTLRKLGAEEVARMLPQGDLEKMPTLKRDS
jgi:hypothetical protein